MIRFGNLEDLESVYRLDRDYLDSNWTKNHYSIALNAQQILIYEGVFGLCGFLAFQSLVDDVELLQIVFDRSCQGTGMSKDLWEHFYNVIIEGKFTRVLVEVREKNLRALGFYNKHGFTEYGFRRNYYGSDEHAILLERRILDDYHGI